MCDSDLKSGQIDGIFLNISIVMLKKLQITLEQIKNNLKANISQSRGITTTRILILPQKVGG